MNLPYSLSKQNTSRGFEQTLFVAMRLWFKIFIKSTSFRLLVCSLQWAGFATDWHSKARRSDQYFELNMNNPALLQTSLNIP
jgi:hypothetical protein